VEFHTGIQADGRCGSVPKQYGSLDEEHDAVAAADEREFGERQFFDGSSLISALGFGGFDDDLFHDGFLVVGDWGESDEEHDAVAAADECEFGERQFFDGSS
jgi:hypothetical protein